MQELNKSVWKGVAISLAVTVVAPIVAPILVRASGPLLRAAGKAGTALFEKGRETAAEMGEVVDDLIAETKAEFAATDAELDEALRKAYSVAQGASQTDSDLSSSSVPPAPVSKSAETSS